MAALLGVDLATARVIAAAAAQGDVCDVANDNDPGQTVLSGHKTAIDRVAEVGKAHGLRRAVPLPVSAPFHCALMKPAADAMAAALSKVTMHAHRETLAARFRRAREQRLDRSDEKETLRFFRRECEPDQIAGSQRLARSEPQIEHREIPRPPEHFHAASRERRRRAESVEAAARRARVGERRKQIVPADPHESRQREKIRLRRSRDADDPAAPPAIPKEPGLRVGPDNARLEPGDPGLQLLAETKGAKGSRRDVTGSAVWKSGDTAGLETRATGKMASRASQKNAAHGCIRARPPRA